MDCTSFWPHPGACRFPGVIHHFPGRVRVIIRGRRWQGRERFPSRRPVLGAVPVWTYSLGIPNWSHDRWSCRLRSVFQIKHLSVFQGRCALEALRQHLQHLTNPRNPRNLSRLHHGWQCQSWKLASAPRFRGPRSIGWPAPRRSSSSRSGRGASSVQSHLKTTY